MSDIEGKVTRVGARERGQRRSFKSSKTSQAALAQFAAIAVCDMSEIPSPTPDHILQAAFGLGRPIQLSFR